jgi:hypothetical protein
MAYKECNEHIPFYTPEEVFEVGTRMDTLPTEYGFTITSDSDRFAHGVLVQVGIVIAGQPFSVDAQVKTFEPARSVIIHGSSKYGKAAVWFNLAPNDDEDGTDINYGVKIGHSLLTIPFKGVTSSHLDAKLPEFAAHYRQNVIDLLDAEQGQIAA